MQPKKGKKRIKNQPVFYDEMKERHMIVVTPTVWKKLQALAIDSDLSVSECLERIVRDIDSD
ncbi:hypothetical protein F7734_50985 [Scytonema sp. UIC 10036]|nr:hypothetical protein [Scytonema sp. UIC 10036]MUG96626.1 hypothetical protein [Scytonema sp. UIC 10036]MUG96707.1 hypothetical protein [Scytonema sp. UIC 10036]MUG98548.1 hypothetical protein [Scytonema sp. UIC 10036]MUG98892.1 hypothetical protein [Scytonema sp. UIC 10036]